MGVDNTPVFERALKENPDLLEADRAVLLEMFDVMVKVRPSLCNNAPIVGALLRRGLQIANGQN